MKMLVKNFFYLNKLLTLFLCVYIFYDKKIYEEFEEESE